MNMGYGGMRKSEIPKNKNAKATKSKKVREHWNIKAISRLYKCTLLSIKQLVYITCYGRNRFCY